MNIKSTRSPLKERPLPVPGTSVLFMIMQKILLLSAFISACIAILGMTILTWGIFITGTQPNPWIYTIMAIIAGLITWYVLEKTKNDINQCHLGRQGEITVAHILEGLGSSGYTLLHDVLCVGEKGGEFNIDHVLIGPKGIFVVETKTWSKNNKEKNMISYNNERIYIDNKRYDTKAINQVRNNAQWLQGLLKRRKGKDYVVTPILTFPGWWIEQSSTDDALQHKLLLVNPKRIGETLDTLDSYKLSTNEIDEVANSIRGYLYEEAVRVEKARF